MSDIYVSVKVEGEDITDLFEYMEIEESDSMADLATLVFGDSDLILSDILHEGLSVEIDLGQRDAHAIIFRGIIIGIRARFPYRGRSIIEIEAADSLIQLSYEPKTLRRWNKPISQIVRDIATDNLLNAGNIQLDEDPVIEEFRPLQQVEETDLAFLHRLARDYDCKLYIEHGEDSDSLSFVSTSKLLSADPVEEKLVFNANMEEFTVSFNAFATNPKISLVSTDPSKGDLVDINNVLARPTDGQWVPDPERIAKLGDAAVRISKILSKTASKRARLHSFWRIPPRNAGASSRQLSDHSGAVGDKSKYMGLTGVGKALGSIWLRPRYRVTIEGYGGRWSGDWYLAKVCHHVNMAERSYYSSFVCTR